MKNSLLYSFALIFLVACNFEIIKHEVKTLSQIEGTIEELPDGTGIKIICFSGYNDTDKNVWTQVVASDMKTGERVRIITPLEYRIPIQQQMTYRTINAADREVLQYLDSIDLKKLDKEANKILNEFNLPALKEALGYKHTDSIKVFFNPKFKVDLEQNLPIIIGKLE